MVGVPLQSQFVLGTTFMSICVFSGFQARYVWAQVRVDFDIRAESGQLVESTKSPC